MMRARACFNANQAGRQGRKELQYLGAAHTLADHHRAINIHAVHLEYRLRNSETNWLTSPMDGSPHRGSL
jgi:hypothetical protein